jgi:flagellar basal-body rod modification protein FlgD
MDTSAITRNSSTTAQGGSSSTPSTNQLGKNDFLKLLTAQLANQDPLQPVDNQAFIAQLAQFSSLEQMQNVSTKLDSLLAAAATSTQVNAASLVGKTVAFNADGVDLTSGQPATMQVQLDARATVTAVVQDASGRTVRTLSLGTQNAGTFGLSWDGLDSTGTSLPSGHYQVTLSATDSSGASVGVQGRAQGTVAGVQVGSSGTSLIVGGSAVNLSDVVEITQS